MEGSLRKVINLAEQFLSVKSFHQGRVHASSVQSHTRGCSRKQRQKMMVLQVQGIEKVLELDLTHLYRIHFSGAESLISYTQLYKAESDFFKSACRMHGLEKVRASLFKTKSVALSKTSMGVVFSSAGCILL